MQRVVFFGLGNDFKNAVASYPELISDDSILMDNGNHDIICGKTVMRPENINRVAYSKIVISTSKYFEELRKQCISELGIPSEKIISLEQYIRLREREKLVLGEIVPTHIKIDACSLCQLDCVSCYMRTNKNSAIGNGYLKFSDFKKLVDENPEVIEIELSNWGETFLNPELEFILEYAHQKDVGITLGNGVNFNTVSEKMMELLVKTQVRFINVSIDGTSQEIYSLYRRKGNYDKVIENIKKLNHYKKLYHSELPVLQWQFIIMEQNEHQVLEAKQMAESLGMRMFFKLQHDEGYVPKNPEFLREVTGLDALSLEEYQEKTGELYITSCNDLIYFPQINWDGRLLGCCRVMEDDFGVNVFEVGLKKALASKKYVEAKRKLFLDTDVEISSDNPCAKCYIYNYMKENNQWYTRKETI